MFILKLSSSLWSTQLQYIYLSSMTLVNMSGALLSWPESAEELEDKDAPEVSDSLTEKCQRIF